MNKPQTTVSFLFNYDGTSATVVIDTRKGPLRYNDSASFLGPIVEEISEVVDVLFNGSVSSTATIAHGILTATVPSGLAAGLSSVTATLRY